MAQNIDTNSTSEAAEPAEPLESTPAAATNEETGAADTEAPADGTQEAEATEVPTAPKRGNEAAKYRTRLREVEAERDTLTAQLDAARETIVNNYLSNQQISLKVAGIKQLGYSTADLLNDDLSLNPKALATTLQGIQDAGFSYAKGNGVVSKSGTGSGASIGAGPSWGDAIKNGQG